MSPVLFNGFGMSPRRLSTSRPQRVDGAIRRVAVGSGLLVREERVRRGWGLRRVAALSGLSTSLVQAIESGQSSSLEGYARLADALGLELQPPLSVKHRRPQQASLSIDLVHSALAEFEARRLHAYRLPVAIDEPYQHYQFAGRADLVSWSLEDAALLHIENRTRFPDVQAIAGGYNAKRAYLPDALARRLSVSRWHSQTHVMVCLWSAEVLHALRLRPESFRALCPDGAEAFGAWWAGVPPPAGVSSSLVVLDPLASGRERVFIGLEAALNARPRHRGYSAVAALLSASP